ncbi:hypothetical protein R3P38DRAFT_3617403 [Favolaschia claudopus]|uniref:Uncharacterized protein n=1 Tax=Favolaschia claudopus TaxID=2862362 RepID=A0AAW0A4G8_9AGAR
MLSKQRHGLFRPKRGIVNAAAKHKGALLARLKATPNAWHLERLSDTLKGQHLGNAKRRPKWTPFGDRFRHTPGYTLSTAVAIGFLYEGGEESIVPSHGWAAGDMYGRLRVKEGHEISVWGVGKRAHAYQHHYSSAHRRRNPPLTLPNYSDFVFLAAGHRSISWVSDPPKFETGRGCVLDAKSLSPIREGRFAEALDEGKELVALDEEAALELRTLEEELTRIEDEGIELLEREDEIALELRTLDADTELLTREEEATLELRTLEELEREIDAEDEATELARDDDGALKLRVLDELARDEEMMLELRALDDGTELLARARSRSLTGLQALKGTRRALW